MRGEELRSLKVEELKSLEEEGICCYLLLAKRVLVTSGNTDR